MAQNDSTYCFTKSQVKVFLTTKVELNNCNDQYNLISTEKQAISDSLTTERLNTANLEKKVKRNRRIAIGGVGGFIAVIVLMFAIK